MSSDGLIFMKLVRNDYREMKNRKIKINQKRSKRGAKIGKKWQKKPNFLQILWYEMSFEAYFEADLENWNENWKVPILAPFYPFLSPFQ